MAESLPSEARSLRLRLGDVSFPLDAVKLVVGRSRSCDVRLRDDTVSRLHAAFVWREGDLVLEDMGSSNGTFLNGERLFEPRNVAPGDDVRFGSLCGTVERDDPTKRAADTTGAPVGRPAGLGWRVLAVVADLVLFSVGSVIAFTPVLATRYLLDVGSQAGSFLSGVSSALWLVFTFLYWIDGWGRRGCTPGLRLCRLRLLDWRYRSPIGYPRAFLRLVALLVTFLTLGLGYLLVPFRRDRKALHDLLAGTLVTRRPAPLGGRPPSA